MALELQVFLSPLSRPSLLWECWIPWYYLVPGSFHFISLSYSNSIPTESPSWSSLGSSSLSPGSCVLVTGGLDSVIHGILRCGLWLGFCFPCSLTSGREFVDYPSAKFLVSESSVSQTSLHLHFSNHGPNHPSAVQLPSHDFCSAKSLQLNSDHITLLLKIPQWLTLEINV